MRWSTPPQSNLSSSASGKPLELPRRSTMSSISSILLCLLLIDVREVLRERLGNRLLPFALRRSPAVGEALAEGMTVLDYAPASPIAQDFISFGAWIKTHSAPAGAAGRGARWVEQ